MPDSPSKRSNQATTWTPNEIAVAEAFERLRALLREAVSSGLMPAEWVERVEDELDE